MTQVKITTTVEDKAQFVEQRAKFVEDTANFMLGRPNYGAAAISRLQSMLYILLYPHIDDEDTMAFSTACTNLRVQLMQYIRTAEQTKKIDLMSGQVSLSEYGRLQPYFEELDNLTAEFYRMKKEAGV